MWVLLDEITDPQVCHNLMSVCMYVCVPLFVCVDFLRAYQKNGNIVMITVQYYYNNNNILENNV